MASPRLRHHHLSKGKAYSGPGLAPQGLPEGSLLGSGRPLGVAGYPHPSRLAHLTASPEELGLIGAELAKRLNLAAEEFLTELVSEQVRASFREELGGMMAEEDDEV